MLRAEDHYELQALAEMAIADGHYQLRTSGLSTKLDEVEQTFRLMYWSTRDLAKLWQPIFAQRGMQMRMTGVFCHKTPLATFDASGNDVTCELGDLLVVHDALGHRPRRRAAILQAKRTDKGAAKSLDAVQTDLYRRLPPFRLSRPGHKSVRLKPGDRDIGSALDFARFALVADDADVTPPAFWFRNRRLHAYPGRPAYRAPWTVAHPAQDPVNAVGAETFGSFLTSMLYDTHPARGQTVQPVLDLPAARLGTGQDLDITVQELMELTAKRLARGIYWTGLKRGIVAFQEGSSGLVNPGSPFPVGRVSGLPPEFSEPEFGEEEDEGGMSILLIETMAG
ncbi:hypothetical protein [Sphingomonas sp. Leaf205]|uniref:hypothetical protein n=1 Tax=Sphingomonas sp. Leaf205 TaxID=2876551 RepID=UPI001E4012F1|nr:hypothetical protein [Sphingomonas sp. Leaf205]